jgi:hypothetical protein
MKPGDMAQLEDDKQFNRQFRATIALGAGMMVMLLMATLIGVFFGWLIWGVT